MYNTFVQLYEDTRWEGGQVGQMYEVGRCKYGQVGQM